MFPVAITKKYTKTQRKPTQQVTRAIPVTSSVFCPDKNQPNHLILARLLVIDILNLSDAFIGSLMLCFLFFMMLASLLPLLIQSLHAQQSKELTLKMDDFQEPKLYSSDFISEESDSLGQLSCFDGSHLCAASDVPFEIVKRLSSEFSLATKNYLEKRTTSELRGLRQPHIYSHCKYGN